MLEHDVILLHLAVCLTCLKSHLSSRIVYLCNRSRCWQSGWNPYICSDWGWGKCPAAEAGCNV